jgi:molybdate transport system substrate-binding protein
MKAQLMIAAIAVTVLPLLAARSQAAEIKLSASTAVKTVLEDLLPQFEKATGNKVVVSIAPAAVLKKRIDEGAAFDVAILTLPLTESLIKEGKAATAHTIAHAGIGVAIRRGAAKPDISTTEAFKHTLLDAKSIGFTAGGASGDYLKGLFDKLGIADAVKPKLQLLKGPAGEAAARGDVEIGMTQISEILPYADAEFVGPLPSGVQSYTYFSATVAVASKEQDASKALIQYLAAPAALAVIKGKGMEPG